MKIKERAREIAPCHCESLHKDGSHWHDCPSLLQDDIAAALRQVRDEAARLVDGFGAHPIRGDEPNSPIVATPYYDICRTIAAAIRRIGEE